MNDIEGYFIKPGYRSNIRLGQKVMFGGQQNSVEESRVWQYEVYEYASRLIKRHNLRNVLDIGCGCGMKLRKLIFPVCQDVTGIDEPETIAWCKQHLDFGTWYADNLEAPQLDLGRTFDLIISADVIEHLVKPDKLLELIKKFSLKNTLIVLSTPERDAVRGKDDMGPPSNPLHAREWNFDEFRKYIEYKGFRVIKHFRAEDSTPPRFQNARFRRVIKLVRNFISLLRRRKKLPLGGQVLLLKGEF